VTLNHKESGLSVSSGFRDPRNFLFLNIFPFQLQRGTEPARSLILKSLFFFSLIVLSGSCYADSSKSEIEGNAGTILLSENFGMFNEPWAMTFLPEGDLLITEKSGNLIYFRMKDRSRIRVGGVPDVVYRGQGGLGDIILHPQYQDNHLIYLSYVEEDGSGNSGAVVLRARLQGTSAGYELKNMEVLWRQTPKVAGNGHFSHRLAFSSDGSLFISSGERQKQAPAQSWTQNLGKIIRLNDDGSVPEDNPFQDKGELAKTFWTLGHRNILGIAFDKEGRLWTHEMGPRHGDEFNLILRGANYGWPLVSWGDQYSGASIPDHDTRPEFHSPEAYWVPSIAPSGLVIYEGALFSAWQGNALIGGLVSKALIRVNIQGSHAMEVERFVMEKRIREVEQGPDGALWVLEDQRGGRLLRLTPISSH
jgi:glucose/arabinose dehydrogenase